MAFSSGHKDPHRVRIRSIDGKLEESSRRSGPEPLRERKGAAKALAANALTTPLNLILLVGIVAAGVIAGAPTFLSLAAALLVYAAACAMTFFDEKVAQKVLGGASDSEADDGSIEGLDPAIRQRVTDVRERERRIKRAIEAADMPYLEVMAEVDSFVTEAERSARSAQFLTEVVDDIPTHTVRAQLADARQRKDQRLVDALEEQLNVAERVEKQLQAFHSGMERMCVELDTVRAQILSASVSTESITQQRIAEEVQGLRAEMSDMAAGVEKAYADAAA